MDDNTRRVDTWIQLALLLLVLIGFAVDGASRLSAIEAWEKDADAERTQIVDTLARMETRLDQAIEKK